MLAERLASLGSVAEADRQKSTAIGLATLQHGCIG
jgi:hypothetical protein